MKEIKNKQAEIYSNLKFFLKRNPLMKEWEEACKINGISYRVGKSLKFCFKNFKEVAKAGNLYNHKVISIEELPNEQTVYNITVDDNHTVAVITSTAEKRNNKSYSGIFAAQCGELPLGLDSCRLLVINLLSFVKSPFTSDAKFDYDLYSEVVQKAQRLMDDLIDLEIEKIEKIIEKIKNDPEPLEIKQIELSMWNVFLDSCKKGRRTGLGPTALGDCIASLNVKYGSKESINITEKIYNQLAVNSYTSSCIMAKERGSFPIFDYKLEKEHRFLNKIISDCNPKIKAMWKKTGRRNIANTTTAPTGSVSTLTQTTSGIEPAYMLSYVRRKKINPSDKNAKIDFTDAMGDKWQEFTIYHHGIKRWMDITGEVDITKSPYQGATSNEIDWMASVDIQAAAQKNIDHSISKTCNLPSTATESLVSQVYMKAYDSHCKGFTVYRDGCRTGVLVSEEEHKKQNLIFNERPVTIQNLMAPKRPIELSCDVKKAKVNGEAWTLFVGLLNGKPYEIFGGLSKFVDIPNKYKAGKILKNGKNSEGLTTYNLSVGESDDDQMTIKDIANIFENKTYEAFTRIVSLNLRHGTPIQYIVEQLTKDKFAEITSFSKVVARVLKSYIKDGSQATQKKCPACELENTLIYQEGCLSCSSCKWSKCS
jgi:ribonucleoside-diphosphate reductase alpha chain